MSFVPVQVVVSALSLLLLGLAPGNHTYSLLLLVERTIATVTTMNKDTEHRSKTRPLEQQERTRPTERNIKIEPLVFVGRACCDNTKTKRLPGKLYELEGI